MNIQTVKDAILSKDVDATKVALSGLKEAIEKGDDNLALELTVPAVITELHQMLVEHLGVNQRLMQLRVKVPHRRKRAILFSQAMLNGVNYLGK